MNMNETVAEMECTTIFRTRSRFDQFNPASCYKGSGLYIPIVLARTERDTTFDISRQTVQHGFRTDAQVSGLLYCRYLHESNAGTLQNIGALCHAFLYHVDLDQNNSPELVFPVPFNRDRYGHKVVSVRATLKRTRTEFILFELAE